MYFCILFENYLHFSKGPYQVFLSGDLYIHLERGIKLLLFADQEIRLRIRRLHHFEIQIDHITKISSKYLFGDEMQKNPTLNFRTGGSCNCYKKFKIKKIRRRKIMMFLSKLKGKTKYDAAEAYLIFVIFSPQMQFQFNFSPHKTA